MNACPHCSHPWSAHGDEGCTIQHTDNFGPTVKCLCRYRPMEESPTERDLEKIVKISSYVDLFAEYVSPVLQAAERAEDPGEELTALSIALLTVAHISMQPFSDEGRAEIDAAAAVLFDQFYESVTESKH